MAVTTSQFPTRLEIFSKEILNLFAVDGLETFYCMSDLGFNNNEIILIQLYSWVILECVILDSQGDEDLALDSHYHALSPHLTSHCRALSGH